MCARNGWWRWCCRVMVVSAAVAATAWIGCRESIGAEGAAEDPFGGRQPAAGGEQRRKTAGDELLRRTAESAWIDLNENPQDALVLDNGLTLIHAGVHHSKSAADVVARLAKQRWMQLADESPREMVQRLDALARRRRDAFAASMKAYRERAAELGLSPERFDWRTRREDWLKLVELIVATKQGNDAASQWRQAAAAAGDLADWYRIAHLLVVREAREAKLDFEWIEPLFDRPPRHSGEIRWTAETLTTMLTIGVPSDDPDRLKVRDRLLTALADLRMIDIRSNGLLDALAGLYQIAERQRAPEGPVLLQRLLEDLPASSFVRFASASQAAIPLSVQRELLLAKPVQVGPERGTLAETLEWLAGQTGVPVWIDRLVIDEGGRLPVPAAEGPWLTVLQQVLNGTPYRVHLLAADLVWIGPDNRLDAARQTYRESMDKLRWAGPRPAAALLAETRIEFIRTPLEQTAAFLTDQHDVNMVVLAGCESLVTIRLRHLPLHLSLTLMTRQLGCDWFVDRQIIFISSPEIATRCEQRALARLARRARLAGDAAALARALRSETRLEFIETPLKQVTGFLAEMHHVPIRVSEEAAQERLSETLKGITLEQALDVICWKLGLTWDAEGQTIELRSAKADEEPGRPLDRSN